MAPASSAADLEVEIEMRPSAIMERGGGRGLYLGLLLIAVGALGTLCFSRARQSLRPSSFSVREESTTPFESRLDPNSSPQRLLEEAEEVEEEAEEEGDDEDDNKDLEVDGLESALPASLQSAPGRCPSTSASGPSPSFGEAQPSGGCSTTVNASKCKGSRTFMRKVKVWDPDLQVTVTRHFAMVVPHSVCNLAAGESVPLMFWFHGQFGSAADEASSFGTSTGYRSCAHDHSWISVFPMGLGLYNDAKALNISNPRSHNFSSYNNGEMAPMPNLGTGWNVGTGGDSTTCLTEDTKQGIFANVAPTEYSCYASCQVKGECGRCNWSTCHDDIAFVKTMITTLEQEYCIDRSRIYAGGQSNGGMFTHYLSQAMPGVFAALNPIYGLPLTGYAAGRDGELIRSQSLTAETAIIEFHGREDKVIPTTGGPSTLNKWAWYYASLEEMMSLWSSLHGCEKQSTDVTAQIKSTCPQVAPNVECREHLNCGTNRRVIYCLYDGHHGDLPGNQFFGCASVWFFNQFRRTSVLK